MIVVTGAAGFIGSYLVSFLNKQDRENIIVVVSRFKYIEVDYEEIAMLASSTADDPQSLNTPGMTPGEDG